MKVEPQKEHQWLERLVGEWTSESEMPAEPGQEPTKYTGTESVRSLGGVWVLCEGRGAAAEGSNSGSDTTIMTLGYDPSKQRYVGTFIGAMMTYLWVYEGELDSTGNVLILDSEGPSFTEEGKMVQYKDSIEFLSDDHRTLTSRFLGDDGEWHHFMTAHYRRK